MADLIRSIRSGADRAGRLFASLSGRHITPRMAAEWAVPGLLAGARRPLEVAVCALLLPIMLLIGWHVLCGIVQDMAHPEIGASPAEQPRRRRAHHGRRGCGTA